MSKVDCKVVLLGSAAAGKTCLLSRYIHDTYNPKTEATIAGSFASKKEELGDITVTLGCWDTAGSERYASISRMYYRKAKAAIVCFDLQERSSYEQCRNWVSELMQTEPDCKVYVCGTKKDLVDSRPGNRAINTSDARELALDLQADYFETSSKTGENIDKVFKKIAKDYVVAETESSSNGFIGKDSIRLSSWKKDSRVRSRHSCCQR